MPPGLRRPHQQQQNNHARRDALDAQLDHATRQPTSAPFPPLPPAMHRRGGQREPEWRRTTRLLSAGGPTAGRSWTAQAGLPGTALTDAEWRAATRFRLGGPYQCMNAASDPDARNPRCSALLGRFGCHALACAFGPLRVAHHNELADLVGRFTSEAGAVTVREAPIREFTTDRPAIRDVCAFGTAEIPT